MCPPWGSRGGMTLMERMHTASTCNGNGEVLDVHGHGEEVSGYNNGFNQDGLTTGQVCSRSRVVRNEWGSNNDILEVHGCYDIALVVWLLMIFLLIFSFCDPNGCMAWHPGPHVTQLSHDQSARSTCLTRLALYDTSLMRMAQPLVGL